MKQLIFLFLLFIQAFLVLGQNNQNLFILDASGSMWQKLDQEFKISIAKRVMNDLVQSMPDGDHLGLIAYGHNRNSDCNDIETLVPLARLDRKKFTTQLEAINPKGKTPIAQSIKHALTIVKDSKTPVNIILVSDGLETCEGNACELVKQAKTQGVKITLHVVGFGITDKDLSPLECLAQAGGGQYFPADNADELSESLKKSLESPENNGAYLSVKVCINGKLTDALVRVYKKGATKETVSGRTYTREETNPRILLIPEGEYEAEVSAIELEGRPTQRLVNLNLKQNDTLHQLVEFSKGSFEILVKRNEQLSDAVVILYHSGTKKVAAQTRSYGHAKSNPVKFEIMPGLYDVYMKSVEIQGQVEARIEKQLLKGGATVSLSHQWKSGELKVGAFKGKEYVDATIGIYSKKSKQHVGSGRSYMSASTNPKTFILEPGEYEIRLNAVKPVGLGKKTLTAIVKERGLVEIKGEW